MNDYSVDQDHANTAVCSRCRASLTPSDVGGFCPRCNWLHGLWYGPFLWGDGSEHPCPADGSMHGQVRK